MYFLLGDKEFVSISPIVAVQGDLSCNILSLGDFILSIWILHELSCRPFNSYCDALSFYHYDTDFRLSQHELLVRTFTIDIGEWRTVTIVTPERSSGPDLRALLHQNNYHPNPAGRVLIFYFNVKTQWYIDNYQSQRSGGVLLDKPRWCSIILTREHHGGAIGGCLRWMLLLINVTHVLDHSI